MARSPESNERLLKTLLVVDVLLLVALSAWTAWAPNNLASLLLSALLLAIAVGCVWRLLLPQLVLTIGVDEILYQRTARSPIRASDHRFLGPDIGGVLVTKQGLLGYNVAILTVAPDGNRRSSHRMFGKVPHPEEVTGLLQHHGHMLLSQREWAKAGAVG